MSNNNNKRKATENSANSNVNSSAVNKKQKHIANQLKEPTQNIQPNQKPKKVIQPSTTDNTNMSNGNVSKKDKKIESKQNSASDSSKINITNQAVLTKGTRQQQQEETASKKNNENEETIARALEAEEQEEEKEEKEEKEITFDSLNICEPILQSIKSLGWKKPSEIQKETLPFTLQGRDIIGLAETGSGKTGAFAIPILQSLLANPQGLFALILAPTRELAFQISEQFEALGSNIGVKCAVVVGGVDMMDQAIALAKKPHIVVATPGRIVDHLENTKGFSLRQLKFLVLDEADRLLNMDFEKEIDKIIEVIPRERQSLLFSATMTSKVSKLQRASLSNPIKVEVSKKYQTAAGLKQQYMFIPAKYKDCYLVYMLHEFIGNSIMIFTDTCEHTQKLAIMLRHLGFAAIPLHGKLNQAKRLGALNTFKSQNRNILIATDVASRGLDIAHVDVVINYHLPTHSKDYIHRVGRTARAGRSGRAISLVTQYDVELLQRIETLLEKKLDEYVVLEEAVMVMLQRVSDAQRIATLEAKEQENSKDGRRRKGQNKDKKNKSISSFTKQ